MDHPFSTNPTPQATGIVLVINAIVKTLDEAGGSSPESFIYLALSQFNFSVEMWNSLKAMLIQSEVISVQANVVNLTEKGKAHAATLK